MANPTSNYGWVLPTSTDLVTDLPADFDVALQGVDTTTKALNPSTTLGDIEYRSATANTNTRLPIGTTGQVLSVVAGVPAWTTGTTGDIEGVTAGVGISGGGTSGTVTVTNSMATAIDAKGDLIAGTGADAFTRVAVGTNGQLLQADSTASGGVSWVTSTSGAYTQLATGSLSGTTVTLSSISSSYKKLVLVLNNVSLSGSDEILYQINGVTGSTYSFMSWRGGNLAGQSGNSAIGIKIPAGNVLNTDTTYRCVIEFDDYATSGPTISTNYGWINTTSTTSGVQIFSGVGGNSTAAVVSSITLKADYGSPAYTFDNGTYTLFGVK